MEWPWYLGWPLVVAVAGVRVIRVKIFVKITFDLKCAAKAKVRVRL